jgi:hypothetical protein
MECLVYRADARSRRRVRNHQTDRRGSARRQRDPRDLRQDRGQWLRQRFHPGLCAVGLVGDARVSVAADAVPERVAMVMSGGTEGGLSPHFLVFAARAGGAPRPGRRALAIGTAAHREATSRVNRPRAHPPNDDNDERVDNHCRCHADRRGDKGRREHSADPDKTATDAEYSRANEVHIVRGA